MWLDTWYCLLQYVCYSYMCIFSKMKSRWKIKSRPQNSKDKAQIALEKNFIPTTPPNQLSTTKFDSLSLLHPIATSLNNNIDGLQFWNCSLNMGLSSVIIIDCALAQDISWWLSQTTSLESCWFCASMVCKYQQNRCDIWCLHHSTSVQKKKVESSGPQHAAPHTRIKQKQKPCY